uniref:Uncharacterized protein n=1 Tax=Ixodes scapularis TaxID=6945 RepID=A0A4D5RD02_IXOSC
MSATFICCCNIVCAAVGCGPLRHSYRTLLPVCFVPSSERTERDKSVDRAFPCLRRGYRGVCRRDGFGKRRDPVLNFAESLCHVVFGTVELKGSMWPRLVARLLSEHSSRFSSVDFGILGASKVRKTLITLNARCVLSLFVWGIVVWPVPNRMSPVPFLPEGELYNAPGIIFVSAIRGRGILRGLVLQQAGRRC